MAESMIQRDASWDKLVNRYKNVSHSDQIRQDGLILWAMQEGQKEAVNQANRAIYDRPPPPGVNRTGALKRAIKTREVKRGTDAGEVYLDRSAANRAGFYYPLAVEKGTRFMRGRHYWNNARVVMQARFKARGKDTLKTFKKALTVR